MKKASPLLISPIIQTYHPKPSKSELLKSAKLVADAAKSHLRHEQDKVDKPKIAGAAADLLNAASEFGKLDDTKGLGKYVDTAENYLHKYNTSHSTTTTTSTKPHHSTTTTTTTETTYTSVHPGGDHGHSKGGYGEYIKMAEGMLKKHSGSSGGATDTSASHTHSEGGHGNSGSGYVEYVKMAGDFMKKH
ncbi:nodulin-related protein 1 [Abeliophyllum distichum]|uniref:Nodulin-related protein 1 n=1 Tax=Abeliophyllum distichum TaxID=126358 RepID=A0ABD1W008_9LAMI